MSDADWKEVCKRAEMRWMSVDTATIQVRARLVVEAGRKIARLEAALAEIRNLLPDETDEYVLVTDIREIIDNATKGNPW
jgi:hypothetical protein